MNRLAQSMLALLLVLSCTGIANADLNSKERLQAFAKLPDWSGLWAQFSAGSAGAPDDPIELKAFIGALHEHPPYNSEWEAKARTLNASKAKQPEKPHCLWGFPPLNVGSPFIFQAIVTPEETTMIFSDRETRHIYTDGRSHPPQDEMFATPWGDSIGHWDGEVLTVDTVTSSSPANWNGDPLSDRARYTERIRMVNRNTLEDQITVNDPVALSRPWQLTRRYLRDPNVNRIIDQVCVENDRNPVVNGKMTIAPAKP